MKIVFNLHDVGLGNNGGSRTLIRCGESLAELGAEVVFSSNMKSRYNWHQPKGVKFYINRVPMSADVAIATGYHSAKSVKTQKASKKMYYIRGFELWNADKGKLFDSYRGLECIVNSEWLYATLKDHGIRSQLIYPGLDFEWFTDKSGKRNKIMGGLYHQKHKTKRHGFIQKVAEMSGYPLKMLNKDLRNASPQQCHDWYNTLKVWFAPTELEGLHNPPMEAALCGCSLVCTNHPRSGMTDYAIHESTALVYPSGDYKTASEYVTRLMEDKELCSNLNTNMKALLRNKIGDRKTNMKKLLDLCKK